MDLMEAWAKLFKAYVILVMIQIKIANLKGHDISLKNVSAVIDFSSPSSLDDLLKICLENSLPLVCGTTGFSVMQLKNLEVAANKLPLMLHRICP